MKTISKPYAHQTEAGEFIRFLDYWALFMEQGTGKTRVAIDKAWDLYSSREIDCLLVIAPNSVVDQWVTEQFVLHYPDDNWNGYIWDGANTNRSKDKFFRCVGARGLFVFAVNVEAFQFNEVHLYVRETLEERRCLVVVDESTDIKNGRRKPKKGKRSGAKRTNSILDLFENVQNKGILTGTPTPNNPFDLWSQFEFLHKDYFGMDWFYFTHHYGIFIHKSTQDGKNYSTVIDEKSFSIIKSNLKKIEKVTPDVIEGLASVYGMGTQDIIKINSMTEYSGYKNLEELKEKISRVTFFKRKDECLDLPPKVYEKLMVQMGKDQKAVYETLKKEMYAEYAGKELTVANKLVMSMRLSMVTGGMFPYSETDIRVGEDGEEWFDTRFEYKLIPDSGKIKVLLQDLEEVPQDTSVIVWARFLGEVDLIVSELTNAGHSCAGYSGDSDQAPVEDFKRRGTRILVMSEKGSRGLNLQVATLHYFYDNSFRGDWRLQKEDRSHRIGQTKSVLYKDLLCRGTIDEHVYEVIKRKENLINYFRSKSIKEILK